LMEEGIYYYFEHTNDNHKMIVADTPQSHLDCPSKSAIEYCAEISPTEGFVSAIRTWNLRSNLRTGKVTLWDHNFQLPNKKFEAEQPSLFKQGGNKELEIYEYPAGYARKQDGIAPDGGERAANLQKIFDDNRRTAQIRMQELDVQCQKATGLGDCASLTAGYRFQLKNHPTATNNIQHIVVSVTHEAVQSPAYTTAHPLPPMLSPGPGSPNVFIGMLPAWRGIPLAAAAGLQSAKASADARVQAAVADIHMCATPSPVPPHGPGVVINGSATVMINNLPACRLGDTIMEALDPPNSITKGEATVIIGG
jgi:uncharacterized protein involved in type VI secretion and phage assembly